MRSPFLLEALEPSPPQATPGELVQQLTAVARRLSPTGRRHVERALVRQLVDTGVRDRRVLAGAVASLRRALAAAGAGEAEALEVVAQELSAPVSGKCGCARPHERGEMDEAHEAEEGYEADEADEAGDAAEADEADPAHEVDEADEADEADESDEADEADEAYEACEADEAEDADEADPAALAEWDGVTETEDEAPLLDEAGPAEAEAEDLAGWEEVLASARSDAEEPEEGEEGEEPEEGEEVEEAVLAEGPEMESETPAPAEITASLDAVTVSSRTVLLRRAPNPFDLNRIASKNTPRKREVFKALQRTWNRLVSVEKRLASGTGSRAALEATRTTLTQRRDEQAAALKTWIQAHPVDHNRKLAQARKSIEKLERLAAKKSGQKAARAAELARAQKRIADTFEDALRAAARAYEPLKDFQRKEHDVRVPAPAGAVRVKLHDHVIAFATDTPGGMDGGAEGDNATGVATALDRSGISEDKRAILRILSGLEGRFSTVNTWDRAVITFGFTQWTTDAGGDGTLCDLMKAIRSASPDAFRRCFQRYGMDVDGKLFKVTLPDGQVLKGGEAARHVQTSVKHVAALSAAGMDSDVQTAQIRFAEEKKIDAMLAHRLSAGGKSAKLADLLTSEYAVGVMTDRAAGTGEYGTRDAARDALATYVKGHPDADFTQSADREAAGARVLAAIEGLDRDRARSYAALNHQPGSFSG